jgi:hypothetical protein
MEAHTSANEQLLVDGLSFKLKAGANYVTNRRSVSFHPQGSNIYKTNSGTKVLKIVLNSNDWLDISTVRLMFDLKNTNADAAKRLRTVSGPWAFWRRLRVMCGGVVIEDFDYNKTHELYQTLKPKELKANDDVEGFGYRFNGIDSVVDTDTMPGIAGGSHQTVCFKILSGILNQPKFLPLRYMSGGLSFEFELCNSPTDPIVPANDNATFTAANTSNDWEIENPMIKCDVLTLDNSLENSYAEHILSGKSLPINFNTFITSTQVVQGQTFAVNVSRSVSRLKGIFITFYRDIPDNGTEKDWNNFYHPMRNSTVYDSGYELEYQVQIGSKLYPEYPVRSVAEAFSQLRKAVGLNYGTNSIDLSSAEYRKDRFIIGVDTEMISEMGFTGLNTKNGELMNIKVSAYNKSTLLASTMPQTMTTYLNSDQIMEIKDVGITVFD